MKRIFWKKIKNVVVSNRAHFSHVRDGHLTLAGKFSIRIVPNQTPDFVEATVRKYLDQRWEERGSPNKYSLSMDAGGRCWASDPRHPNYEAAATATKMVYGVEPDLTREGIISRADGKSQVRYVWVFVQPIFGPRWSMNLMNKNPNIA